MLRDLSEGIAVTLKDRLRDVRRLVRARRHDRGEAPGRPAARLPFEPGEIDGLIGHAASVMDDALSVAETLSRPFRPAARGPHGFRAYFDGEDGARLFRREMYAASGLALERFAERDALVHEAEFLAAHGELRRRHAGLVAAAAPPGAGVDRVAALAAAALLAMLERGPIAFAERDRLREAALNRRVLAPLALAAGVATLETEVGGRDILDASLMAAEARRDRFEEALDSSEPRAELTRLFGQLLPHLP